MKLIRSFVFVVFAAFTCAAPIACGGFEGDDETDISNSEDEIRNFHIGEDGSACTIERDGLKIPGTRKGIYCCEVLHPEKCVDQMEPPGHFTSTTVVIGSSGTTATRAP